MSAAWIEFAYLIAAILFIFGLKGLTHPRTSVRGNQFGALAMLIAVVATMLDQQVVTLGWILAGLVIGSTLGVILAVKVEMTAMPQMVGLLNGLGGAASVLVAGGYLAYGIDDATSFDVLVATAASGLIGAVTFSGSLVAFAKLQELDIAENLRIPSQQLVNAALAALALLFSILLIANPESASLYWLTVLVGLPLGVLLVSGIGGADMPVVIALLNSYSGLAAAATGFVLGNVVLIIAGSLVGASGLILTKIMCDAMNRSLVNVLFGTLAPAGGSGVSDEIYSTVKSTSPEEVAMLLDVARRVVIVPGYGMAVAQAQHVVSDLAKNLAARGTEVEFAIHPVAGRMPGHMNVLLAEADVPYEQLKEMDVINPTLEQADVVIVLGANDVVNPLARTDPKSPIAGMPIIDVDKARTVVVIKRSLSPGFAGIPNPLFAADNALMLFADGRKAVTEILKAVQET